MAGSQFLINRRKRRYFLFSDYSWLISFIASGLVSNSVAEIVGRKKSLMLDCLAFLTGYALYSAGENAATLCVARAFMGYPLINMVGKIRLYSSNKSVMYLSHPKGVCPGTHKCQHARYGRRRVCAHVRPGRLCHGPAGSPAPAVAHQHARHGGIKSGDTDPHCNRTSR